MRSSNLVATATFLQWSCGNNQHIEVGDRVFMLKQGPEPRELIASGWVTEGSFEEEHWEDEIGDSGPGAWYVKFDADVLSSTPLIPRSRLDEEPFNEIHGIRIDPDVAHALEIEWAKVTGTHFEPGPDEVDARTLPEGAARVVTVNAYERNALARQRCIAHYGCSCLICGLNFRDRYGPTGEGLIHIHHVTPLASIRKRYRVDPVRDLRPVCPNCHAILHRRQPAYTIDEVVSMLRT
jgi:5-methylcytosine-specific restriction enzyme A